MKKIWNYISDVWQGDDDKLSLKRLFIITLVIELVRMLEGGKITSEYMLSAFYALLASCLVAMGIITTAQVMQFRQGTTFKQTKSETTINSADTDNS